MQGIVAMLPGKTSEEGDVGLMQHLREVDPGPHLDWWHVGAMAEACQGVLDGDIERLLISAPPRTHKSRTVVQGTSSCRLRNEPRSKIFVTCANDKLVRYHGRNAKAFAKAAGVRIPADAKAADWWETEEKGVFKAVTIRAGQLGAGWDLGFVDDPFKSRMEAMSKLVQDTVWRLYSEDFLTRKQGRPEGGPAGLIVMHQRLAILDLWSKIVKMTESTGQEWTVLSLKGYAERVSIVLPPSCVLIPERRAPGEPLCDDADLMAPIAERRKFQPQLHRAIDQQDPPEESSGGLICGAWFRPVGQGLGDMDSYPAVIQLAMQGKITVPRRRIRGWDFGTGRGLDLTASALGDVCDERWLWEDAWQRDIPSASIEDTVLRTAEKDGKGVEVGLPNEIGTGRIFSDRVKASLEAAGFLAHVIEQREHKRIRQLPHAQLAAARCGACHLLIVPEASAEMFQTQGVCSCPVPAGDGYGCVDFLVRPWNDMAAAHLNAFTGEEGGHDDLADAMAVAVIVGQSAGGGKVESSGFGPWG